MLRRLLVTLSVLSLLPSVSAATVQFSARQDIQTNFKQLRGLAVADFNGDGKPDLAVTDVYTQNVAIYLNDGTGGFKAPIITTTAVPDSAGFGPLVAGDVNEDGKQDLIVSPVGGNQIDILLLGNGDGTFTQGPSLPGSNGFNHGVLVDINGDKHLDFVSSGNGDVYSATGDGKGNFIHQDVHSPANVINNYPDLAVGDFNGDKVLDLLTVGSLTNQLFFFAGQPSGTFAQATTEEAYASSPYSLASADFNGDGKLDIAIGEPSVAILIFGNGDGTFRSEKSQEVTLPNYFDPKAVTPEQTIPVVASADIDGDGTADIVVADDTYQKLSVLLNDGTGQFIKTQPDYVGDLDLGSGELRLADLNGDGLPDVVVTNYRTQNISIFLSVPQKAAPMISIQSSAAQALVGSDISISVQVKGVPAHVPTGVVSLASGSASYGQQALDATGQATFKLSNLPVGQYELIATYAGDQYNSSATSTAAGTVQSVTDFQVPTSPPPQSVAVGANATFIVPLTPVSGFTGTVTLTCSGLPIGFSCAPTTAVLSAQPTSAALVVLPPATTAKLELEHQDRSGSVLAFLGICGVGFGLRRRRLLSSLVLLGSASVIAAGLLGCSGNGSNATPKAAPYTGTTSFTITATATQGSVTVSHQTTATLTVH